MQFGFFSENVYSSLFIFFLVLKFISLNAFFLFVSEFFGGNFDMD